MSFSCIVFIYCLNYGVCQKGVIIVIDIYFGFIVVGWRRVRELIFFNDYKFY